MSEENLPLPIDASTTIVTFKDNMVQIASDNSADAKDIGIYGKFISSGTKYAALYREAASGRFKYGVTTTLPTDTIASVTLGDIGFPNIYSTAMQSSGFTASTLVGFDSSKNLVSSKIPLTPSYGVCYANAYTRITPSSATWTIFGSIWNAGSCSSEWSINTAVANRGLKYTGANALVQVTYSMQTSSLVNAIFSVGIGSGTPVPVENPNTTGQSIRSCYVVVNDGDYGMCYSSFLATMSTNDSIIFYGATGGGTTTIDIVSGNILALVLEYT